MSWALCKFDEPPISVDRLRVYRSVMSHWQVPQPSLNISEWRAAHPNPTLSLKASANSPPYTMSFLGTQPRSTQVPPAPPSVSDALRAKGSSQIAALMPAHARTCICIIMSTCDACTVCDCATQHYSPIRGMLWISYSTIHMPLHRSSALQVCFEGLALNALIATSRQDQGSGKRGCGDDLMPSKIIRRCRDWYAVQERGVTKSRGCKSGGAYSAAAGPNCEEVKVVLPGAVGACSIARALCPDLRCNGRIVRRYPTRTALSRDPCTTLVTTFIREATHLMRTSSDWRHRADRKVLQMPAPSQERAL